MSASVKTMSKDTDQGSHAPKYEEDNQWDNVAVQWEESSPQWYGDEECTTPWGGEAAWQEDGDEWRDQWADEDWRDGGWDE